MFYPIFTLNLNKKVLPGRVTLGEYDGKHPCLTAATIGEKVFIHNPHQKLGSFSSAGRMESTQANHEIALLNINQRVTALAAGKLDPVNRVNDILLVGTPTNLLAYDAERNADIFYKEVPDGVNTLAIGCLGETDSNPLAIVGGNCSLQGFDAEGNDPFWTVTGDNVTALTVMDYNRDGRNELVVGSEDYEIRIFAKDEILSEITETEAITALTPVQDGRFGYALSNGTVGVYEKNTRWWRIKSKNASTCICAFDLDGDGVNELITGWSNGKIDARNDKSGEVVFKENFNASVAGLLMGDYRMDGKNELIAVSTEGEVRGYLPANSESQGKLVDVGMEQEAIRDLVNRRQNLLLELHNYEQNRKLASSSSGMEIGKAGVQAAVGVIPAQTQLSTSLSINTPTNGNDPHVEITLTTSNDTIIRGVLIFAEGIFEGECHVVHPKEIATSSSVVIPLIPPRDVPVDLHIKAFVGYRNSRKYHVFELTRQLPRFSMYCRVNEFGRPIFSDQHSGDESPDPVRPEDAPEPSKSHVTFHVNERPARVAMWMNQNFLLGDELEPAQDPDAPEGEGPGLKIIFLSLRKKRCYLFFNMKSDGKVTLNCDSMDLCGDFIQALGEYLGLDDLKVTCDFPEECGNLENLLVTADDLQSVRQRLSAEMADNSGVIRTLIVRAEDARLMMDLYVKLLQLVVFGLIPFITLFSKNMRMWYSQLYDLNRDLIAGYKIRCNNHQELMETLKQVNQIIQKAGRLRIGKAKMKVITDCRSAIKASNVNLLLRVIRMGES